MAPEQIAPRTQVVVNAKPRGLRNQQDESEHTIGGAEQSGRRKSEV
jgi:hypothetical protein